MKNKTPLSHFLSKHSSFIPKGIFLSKGFDFWTLCVRARNDDDGRRRRRRGRRFVRDSRSSSSPSVGDAERVDPSTDETRDGRVDYNQRHPRDDAHFIDLISLIVDRNAEEKTRETSEDDAGGGGVWNDDDGGDVDAMGDAG
jgi:hypothetical protein